MKARFALYALPLVVAMTTACQGKSGGDSTTPAPTVSATTPPPATTAPAGDAAASATGASAGTPFEGHIVLRVTAGKAPPVEVHITAKGDKLRLDYGTEREIYDARTGSITVVSDAKKTTSVATAASSDGDPPATITKSGSHENIVGRDCENWDILQNRTRTSVCVTDGIPAFDPASMGPSGTGAPSLGLWLKSLRGQRYFPLRSVTSDASGAIVSRFQTVTVHPDTVEDSELAIPDGYHTK